MAVKTVDVQTVLTNYVDDLNSAVESREFGPFVHKWFAPNARFAFQHDTEGIENAKLMWDNLFPKGENVPREVFQIIYKIEAGRVYSWRQLEGGAVPKPLYGFQETEFDDRSLISEILIRSVQDKPEMEASPEATKSRLGRMTLQFAEAFNEYFMTGETKLVEEWCSPDIKLVIDSSYTGMAIVGPHNRIAPGTKMTLRSWEEIADDRVRAKVDLTTWGGIAATHPWEIAFAPDGKILELAMEMELEEGGPPGGPPA
jgi:hypothetical protein